MTTSRKGNVLEPSAAAKYRKDSEPVFVVPSCSGLADIVLRSSDNVTI